MGIFTQVEVVSETYQMFEVFLNVLIPRKH